MGILGVLLLVVGLVAIGADTQRRTVMEKNERLADALDDECEKNYQLRRRLGQVRKDPIGRGERPAGDGWLPSRRHRLEALFSFGWPTEPEGDPDGPL